MSDPELKLPLRARPSVMKLEKRWVIADADNMPLALTQHQAEICVAALTADAEGTCLVGCVAANMLGESMMLHEPGCPNEDTLTADAEKETKGE